MHACVCVSEYAVVRRARVLCGGFVWSGGVVVVVRWALVYALCVLCDVAWCMCDECGAGPLNVTRLNTALYTCTASHVCVRANAVWIGALLLLVGARLKKHWSVLRRAKENIRFISVMLEMAIDVRWQTHHTTSKHNTPRHTARHYTTHHSTAQRYEIPSNTSHSSAYYIHGTIFRASRHTRPRIIATHVAS